MNLSQIIAQVNRDFGDTYSNSDITDWVNRCLDDLSPLAKMEEKKVTDIQDSNVYELPDDLHEIRFVLVGGKEFNQIPLTDTRRQGYKVWAGELTTQMGPLIQPLTGQVELYYYRKLNHLANTSDIPEIEEPFHDLLILYTIGQMQFEDEDYEDRPDYMTRYQQRKAEYASYVQRKNSEPYFITEMEW